MPRPYTIANLRSMWSEFSRVTLSHYVNSDRRDVFRLHIDSGGDGEMIDLDRESITRLRDAITSALEPEPRYIISRSPKLPSNDQMWMPWFGIRPWSVAVTDRDGLWFQGWYPTHIEAVLAVEALIKGGKS
jgi:hypothetical protein